MNKPRILVIVGPTASGKSGLALNLAKKLNGEIVSADSRQVYKGLDIGSGKVTKREMNGIPHHLLSVQNSRLTFTVSEYQKLAYRAIDDILKRGKLPIVVGGTGLYIQSIVDGVIVPEVAPNPKLRRKLEKLSAAQLYKKLKTLDPARAKQIDKHNPRRLVRAIEIATSLGKVPKLEAKPRYLPILIGLKLGDKKLKSNIHKRLFARMKQGMVAEVKNLHQQGLSWNRMFDLGLEYRYVSLYLQNKITKLEMLTKLELEIKKYAKRQMTWFKRDKRIMWIDGSGQKKYPLAARLARESRFAPGRT